MSQAETYFKEYETILWGIDKLSSLQKNIAELKSNFEDWIKNTFGVDFLAKLLTFSNLDAKVKKILKTNKLLIPLKVSALLTVDKLNTEDLKNYVEDIIESTEKSKFLL